MLSYIVECITTKNLDIIAQCNVYNHTMYAYFQSWLSVCSTKIIIINYPVNKINNDFDQDDDGGGDGAKTNCFIVITIIVYSYYIY